MALEKHAIDLLTNFSELYRIKGHISYVAFFMENDQGIEDLSGPAPESSTQTPALSFIEDKKDLAEFLLNKRKYDALEKRWMRVILYAACVIFGFVFLWDGLNLALTAGGSMVEAKQQIVSSIAAASAPKNSNLEAPFPVQKQEQKSLNQKTESSNGSVDADKKAQDNPDALHGFDVKEIIPYGSIITIIAFILGVGLTLVLTLLKFVFSFDEDKDNAERESISSNLASPISKLVEEAISFIKDKLKR